MTVVKSLLTSLIISNLLILSPNCFAGDSTEVKVPTINPAQPQIATSDCFTTPEKEYTPSMLQSSAAYPACPADMVVSKINIRTEPGGFPKFTDIYHYVSVNCCKQKVTYQIPA